MFTSLAYAQSPEGFSYQAVIRDADFNSVANTNVGVNISIIEGSLSGPSVYSETFDPLTNSYGLINLQIGEGTIISGDFSAINWSTGQYFIETSVDLDGGTNYQLMSSTQLMSVPYTFYSNSAGYADSTDFNNLLNPPTLITPEQIAKIDSITITNAVNLNDMEDSIAANSAIESFPGFGTVPGTVLEGDNEIWVKDGNDVFYNNGSVGVGVPVGTPFDESVLHVGGAILIDHSEISTTPGSMRYDSICGVLRYTDQNGVERILGASYKWNQIDGDITTTANVGVNGSLGVGQDIVNGENFGFNTLILKENNLRILFDDSDDEAGTFPANDWQIEINETSNGGTEHFAVNDITGGVTPFKIIAGAPDHSFFISDNGNVGIGTNTPINKLEVDGNLKADAFIGDGSGITGITGATGGLSNVDHTTIGADTDSDLTGEIALQTQNTTRMTIINNGNVGIGTANPSQALEVVGTAKTDDLTVTGVTQLNEIHRNITTVPFSTPASLDYDVTNLNTLEVTGNSTLTIEGFTGGIIGQELIITTSGTVITIMHNGTGTEKIMLPNATDIVLNQYNSARFIFNGTIWVCTSLNN
jgi:hypothetical protein